MRYISDGDSRPCTTVYDQTVSLTAQTIL